MRIESARVEGRELILSVPLADARRFAYKFKPGEYDLKLSSKKRSLDANGMAWAILHDIAGAVRLPPNEVYREAIRNVGGISEVLMIKKEAVDQFTESFIRGHIGRQVEAHPNANPDYVTLIVTYGSSDYNTAQMSRLIDVLKEDAHALGLTLPEDEKIESLLREWEERYEKTH